MTLRVAVFLMGCGLLYAQEASISGVITDQSGAVIPAAAIHASTASGSVATSTNAQGVYQLPALASGAYVVRVEAPGFTPAERTITLLVGQSLSLDVQLRPTSVSSSVDVSAEAANVTVNTSEVAGHIDSRQMQDIPLNGRNWFELALLVPGITKNDVSNNSVVAGADQGKYQLNIDGQQVTNNIAQSVYGQPGYSRDALAEFQIINNRFDATMGRSLELQINAETKSGSDQFHGTLYGYFRNSALGSAADSVAHTVLPYSDQQFGGTIGGPILRDKLFFFGSFEEERNPATIFTTPTGFGGLTYQFPTETTIRTYLVRFDYQRAADSRYSVRFSGYTNGNPFSGVGGTTHPSQGSATDNDSVTALLSWSKIKSPQLVNELKLGWAYFTYGGQPSVQSAQYAFSGVTVGGNYNYPLTRYANQYQIRDTAYWLKGKHNLKIGGEYINAWYHGTYPQYERGAVSSFSSTPSNLAPYFPVWNEPSTWNLAALSPLANNYFQNFSANGYALSIYRNTLASFIQDDWKMTPRITVNLGLRLDEDLGMTDSSLTLTSGLATPHFGDNDKPQVSPRLGFTWDVMGDRKTAVRGGAGIFYGDVEANQYYDMQLFNGQTGVQASVQAAPGAPINLLAPFGPYTGPDFLNHAAPVPPQAVQLTGAAARTPYSLQMSLGVERQLGKDWTASLDFAFYRIYHEWLRLDENLTYNPATGFNFNPNTTARPNPAFTTISYFVTPNASGAIGKQLLVSVRRSYKNGLSLAGGYTWQHDRDSSNGDFYYPNNPFDLSDEWGNQSGDQRNSLNVNASYKLKWGFQLGGIFRFGSGAANAVTAGSSPFANSASSNRTFLATTKVYDNSSLNYPNALDPIYMLVQRDSFYGQPIYRVDTRLSKTVTLKEHYRIIGLLEVFNLFNHANFGSYQTSIVLSSFGQPAANTNLAYAARMLQLAGRFEF